MRTYVVNEIFPTLQGEGFNFGVPALFVRFSSCNMWTGRAVDRHRDAMRHRAECPLWCDTNFVSGDRVDLTELLRRMEYEAKWFGDRPPLVVLTGGEPLLQLDADLLKTLRRAWYGTRIAVETNGTINRPEVTELLDWVTVSPKQPPGQLVMREGNELKIVYPAYDPREYVEYGEGFEHWFISPQADTTDVGVSRVVDTNMRRAADFCMADTRWRLSLQAHKVVGLR